MSLLALIAVWLPQGGTSTPAIMLWATAGTTAGLGFLLVGSLVGFGRGDRRHWRWLGVAAALIAAFVSTAAIWSESLGEPDRLNLFITIAICVACANLICRIELKPQQRLLRVGTLLTGAVAAVLWVIAFSQESEDLLRIDAAFAIPALCGAVALAVVHRLNRGTHMAIVPAELQVITVFCPRCRKKQTLKLGGDSCKACCLEIEVRAQAPTCRQCGYLLYNLTSDRCPECGESIAKAA